MGTSILPSLVWFAIVVALIPVALAVVRRSQQLRPGRAGVLRLVGGLPVGTRERIAVIEAGGKWLVVGITPQSISLLSTLDEPPVDANAMTDPSTAAPAGAFDRILSGFRKDASPRD